MAEKEEEVKAEGAREGATIEGAEAEVDEGASVSGAGASEAEAEAEAAAKSTAGFLAARSAGGGTGLRE